MTLRRGRGEGSKAVLRADGRWQARKDFGTLSDGRRDRRSFYGATQQEVARKMQAAIRSHENGQLSRTKSRAVTVAMMAEAHAAHLDARVLASTLKADTRDWYVRLLRIHVVEPHRTAKVADIRPSTVEAWISAEPHLSGSTRRGIYIALRGALEVMVKDKVIPTNPAKEVTGPRANSKSPEPAESLDVEKMLKVASDEMQLAIEVLALTGIRRAELLTIQWKHVNLVDARLTVTTAKQRAGSPVKTRVLPIRGQLRELLVEQGTHHPEEYLVRHERDPLRPRDGRAFSRSFQLVAERAGVEVTPHQLRHRAATEMLHAGIPSQSIIKVLGHSSSKMLDVYGHSRDAAEEAAMDVLGS